jgi:hypothetical protein
MQEKREKSARLQGENHRRYPPINIPNGVLTFLQNVIVQRKNAAIICIIQKKAVPLQAFCQNGSRGACGIVIDN